tara:strand:+ start:903 stop:1154 length:252 start_codon:yes stop_codon:yes gene_type:complete
MRRQYILVGRADCTHCSKAMGLIREGNGSATYYSLNDSKWLLDLFKRAKINTVPQIWDTEGNYIGGYTELKKLIEKEKDNGNT